jgi:hypothetical protein
MYEAPKLQLIGPACEVVLGIVSHGDDIDGFCVPTDLCFAEDVGADADS